MRGISEFYEDLQLCPGGAIPYSVELKKTFDKEKKEHFKHIPNAKSCDKLECPGEYICRKSKKSAKCCPRDFRHTDYAVSVGIISQSMLETILCTLSTQRHLILDVTVTRQYCPAGKPASVKEKTLSCGIFFNKESPEICPKDHVCLEFNNEESRCCPSTGAHRRFHFH